MNLGDELAKLQELHQRGALTDEEFTRAKARVIGGSTMQADSGTASPAIGAVNALRRSQNDRWIAGVCGGVARATGLDSWVWRLLFATLALFAGTGVVLYALLWIFVPSD